MKIRFFIFFFLALFLLGNIFAQESSLDCQYIEQVDSGDAQRVFRDDSGDVVKNPLDFTFSNGDSYNVGGPCKCDYSFTIKNNADSIVSFRLYYVSLIGGKRYDNSTSVYLKPYETKTISRNGVGAKCWSSCGVEESSISYQFYPDSEIQSDIEKILVDICKKCGEVSCLNDGNVCSSDFECGSGVCNLAGFCGHNKVVECPKGHRNCNNETCSLEGNKTFGQKYNCVWECADLIGYEGVCRSCPSGFKNCNNESCLEEGVKKIGEKYSCEFECETKYGAKGYCKTSVKEKILKGVFILVFILVFSGVIYFIWTNKFFGRGNVKS